MTTLSSGAKFRAALAAENPLQVIGAINAYTARMAERTGFKALYLSGGGVAANSLGMPDLGISALEDVLVDVRRITEVTTLPLLVDIDTMKRASEAQHRLSELLEQTHEPVFAWKLDGRFGPAVLQRVRVYETPKIWADVTRSPE